MVAICYHVLARMQPPGSSWRLLGLSGVELYIHCTHWALLEVSGNSWRGYWRLLEAAGASEGFWRLLEASGGAIGGSWRILETPGGSWRLLEAPGSSQAGGPPDLFTKHLEGANAIDFSPTYPQTGHFEGLPENTKSLKKQTFKLKLKSAHTQRHRKPRGG